MKSCLSAVVLILISAISLNSYSQSGGTNLDEGYYVVIGVYAQSKENYAIRYMEKAREMGYQADYGFSPKRNYYYVYVFSSENYREAINKMRETRKINEFSEAWVYVHLKTISPRLMTKEEQEVAEKTDKAMKEKVVDDLDKYYEEKFKDVEKDSLADETNEEDSSNTATTKPVEKETAEKEDKDYAAKVHFNLHQARTGKSIDGEVQIIDAERAKLLDVAESGQTVEIQDPNNRTGNLALIVDAFGYRKTQLPFNCYDPDTSLPYVSKDDNEYVVDLELQRYRKGDIAVMYNVYFYKDAALMLPESKFELNSLVDMMKENPNYKIKIHGHTNGNSAGKIISLGDSDDLFALTDANKEGISTAKKLSKERAEIVKEYLVRHGIDANRMDVKGWGGKKMLHEKFGTLAKNNVRVEIEILKD